MLGWFKKKFKKQEPVAPPKEVVVDDLPLDTPTSPYEETESDTVSAVEQPTSSPEEEQPAIKSPEPKIVDLAVEEPSPLPPADSSSPVLDENDDIPTSSVHEDDKADFHEPTLASKTEHEPEPATEAEPAPEVEPTDTIVAQTDKQINIVKESDVESQAGRKKKSLFSRLTEKLGKTRETFTYQLDALFLGKKVLDTDMLDDLEEILITADLGVGTTQELLENARRKVKRKELYDPESLKKTLKLQIKNLITANDQDASLVMPEEGPFVIMVIGVNGVGKTTTIGKIAKKFQQTGKSVLLVAGDTFRAAAVSQLKIWGERSNVEVVAHKDGSDPSSVIYDALGIAQAKNVDVVLVDTAGRMHTKDNLMEELKKIKRVMGKKMKGAPHEIMLVIDATTGQNGISQARLFDDAVGVTGITLTKLDGTAKGGIVANICKEMKIPIRFIGIGEKMEDLRDFDAVEFVDALFHSSND
jgi:fused signal recognition particle receptor